MKVLKFGGSSVGSVESVKLVIEIVEESINNQEKPVVVVSAFQGTTNNLVLAARKASIGDLSYVNDLTQIIENHEETAGNLVTGPELIHVNDAIVNYKQDLDKILYGVFLLRELTPRTLDHLLSFGELLSSMIIAEAFISRGIKSSVADARKFIKTDSRFGNAHVLFSQTNKLIREYFAESIELQIVAGFISSNAGNETTTLGRGGSDYTAAIIGAALNAEEIQIWTDVDGVLSADPRIVKIALPISELSFDEALEMSYFGAKVIYPPTIRPARLLGIPIVIKNTFNKSFPGTRITA